MTCNHSFRDLNELDSDCVACWKERAEKAESACAVLVEALEVWKCVIALTPIPPRPITYEVGWRILDAVQETAPLFNKALAAVKGEQK